MTQESIYTEFKPTLSEAELKEILGYGLTKVADTSSYVSYDISTVSDTVKKLAQDFENYKENNMKKEVLFLAPSYEYAKAVVTNLGKRLDKKEIPYNSSVYPKTTFSTDGVNVTFVYSDPLKWYEEMFHGKNAIFGKKEMVEKARERFFHMMHTPKMSLEKYVIENTVLETKPAPIPTSYLPEIKNVHFNGPATVVLWEDGTKTIVKCQDGDIYSEETGLALCIAKKAYGNMPNFNNIFRKWIPETPAAVTIELAGFDEIIRKEAKKQKAIQTAYNLVNDFLNAEDRGEPATLDLEEIRGYLGEALE